MAPKNSPPPAHTLNPLEPLVGYHLRRASLSVSADLARRLEPLGLTVVTLSVLLVIDTNPGVSQSLIGRLLGIKSANMAPLIGQLAQRDLVARVATDGRSHGLMLSEAGLDLARQAQNCVAAHEAWFLQGLTARESEDLARLLQLVWSRAPMAKAPMARNGP